MRKMTELFQNKSKGNFLPELLVEKSFYLGVLIKCISKRLYKLSAFKKCPHKCVNSINKILSSAELNIAL